MTERDDELRKLSDEERVLREDLSRASRADALLKDELLIRAFESVEKALHERWQTSKEEEAEAREEVFRRLKTLEHVRSAIERHIRQGKLSEKELEDIQVRRTFIMKSAEYRKRA